MKSLATHSIRITMAHVDAAGLIFFPRLYDLCESALEVFFEAIFAKNFHTVIFQQKQATIIVHSEADYKKPIRLGDHIKVVVACTHVGTTSFTIHYKMYNTKEVFVAEAKTVHVLIDLVTFEKVKISDEWRSKILADS
ncbi:hypothetical protein COTS27_00468 [Spirochaetota bacterium]|nr:hypothetical protein COTS27_00468 [Spirochaetota bacterium]